MSKLNLLSGQHTDGMNFVSHLSGTVKRQCLSLGIPTGEITDEAYDLGRSLAINLDIPWDFAADIECWEGPKGRVFWMLWSDPDFIPSVHALHIKANSQDEFVDMHVLNKRHSNVFFETASYEHAIDVQEAIVDALRAMKHIV